MSRTAGLFSHLEELASKKTTQWLYKYKMKPLLKAGSLGLSAVLVVYGITFSDMAWFSVLKGRELATEEETKDWKYLLKVYGPLGLTILPFTLSLGTLWTFSRAVTKIELVPVSHGVSKPMFKVVRQSAILGRPKEALIGVNDLVKAKNARIYTGEGEQGIVDKGTYCFYLTNKSKDVSFWNKQYIVSRSGDVWKSDGRILEALFNASSKTEKKSLLNEMIELNKDKQSFHSNSTTQTIKDIILNTQKR
ncbi:hypothetical protein MOSE0_E00584 [Monosporozyma servazzii]